MSSRRVKNSQWMQDIKESISAKEMVGKGFSGVGSFKGINPV